MTREQVEYLLNSMTKSLNRIRELTDQLNEEIAILDAIKQVLKKKL